MNATMRHFIKRTGLSLVIGAGLLVLGAANVSAHEVEYRPYYAPAHLSYARTKFYPGWLRRNLEFQRWYLHNQYRFGRRVSWIRLYDIFRFERRHRGYGRRIHRQFYHRQGYRSYYPLPGNHRH